ncbi:hypothetical protein D3C72_793530 [compost metagenome]
MIGLDHLGQRLDLGVRRSFKRDVRRLDFVHVAHGGCGHIGADHLAAHGGGRGLADRCRDGVLDLIDGLAAVLTAAGDGQGGQGGRGEESLNLHGDSPSWVQLQELGPA